MSKATTYSISNVDAESDDIFAGGRKEEDKTVLSARVSSDEETAKEGATELSAAAALTSLVAGSSHRSDGTAAAAADEEEEAEEEDGDSFHIPQRFTKSGRKRAVPFPLKLMKVLSNKENEEIIAWMPSGKSFSILKPKVFVAEILPTHFKSAKYSSFTRKLHRWGFMRHYRGEEAGAFFHADFQKGRLDLVEKMTCHKDEPSKSGPAIAKVVPEQRKEAEKKAVQELAPRPKPIAAASVAPVVARPAAAAVAAKDPVAIQSLPPTPRVPIPQFAAAAQPATAAAQPASAAAQEVTVDRSELNAAIELEVTRRLQERINAAALSRQALVLMQQQLKPPAAPAPPPVSMANANLIQTALKRKALLAGLQVAPMPLALTKPYDPFGLLAIQGDGAQQPLAALPRTNIQGAKTA